MPWRSRSTCPASLRNAQAGRARCRTSRRENLPTYRIGLKCFFEEGRALAADLHPNVVRVLNFFRANETVYMVMAYESGRSLQEHMLRHRARASKDVLPERFIRRIFAQVMNGLREVHANKLLHLDLKPANIYLRMDGTPILLDFGAARQTLQRRHAARLYPMYTPGFAAPELYKRDAELGPWTDIYGIGACMYACMVGRAAAGVPTSARPKTRCRRRCAQFRGLYSHELISIVERCLRLDPLERPQSVSMLCRRTSHERAREARVLDRRQGWRQGPQRAANGWLALHETNTTSPGSEATDPCDFRSIRRARTAGDASTRTAWGTLYTRDSLLMVVADGMGGHARGEVAAELTACRRSPRCYQRDAKPLLQDPMRYLEEALLAAHRELHRYRAENNLPEAPRTTMVACIDAAGHRHLGACRRFAPLLIRGGRVVEKTSDHSRVNHLVATGVITAEQAKDSSRTQPHLQLHRRAMSRRPWRSASQPRCATATCCCCARTACGATCSTGRSPQGFVNTTVMRAVPELVETALARGGADADNCTAWR